MDHRTHPAVRENHNPWKITIFAYGGAPIRENMIFRMQVLTSPARENKILKKNQINGNPNSLFRHSAATAAPTATIARSGRGTAAATRTGRWAVAAAGSRRGEGGTAPGRLAREWEGGRGVVERWWRWRCRSGRRLLVVVGGSGHRAASSSSSSSAASAAPLSPPAMDPPPPSPLTMDMSPRGRHRWRELATIVIIVKVSRHRR